MGDILISSRHRPSHFMLPTLFDNVMPYLPHSAVYGPVDLNQKLYLPSPHICVAVAGSFSYIKPFLEDLTVYCRVYPNARGTDIEAFLQSYVTADTMGDMSVLLLALEIIDGESYLGTLKGGHWEIGTSPLVGNILAAGSGAQDFITVSQLEAHTTLLMEAPPLEQAIFANIVLLARVMAQERALLSTITQYWGAGFEITYVDRGAFHKLDNITYIIYEGQLTAQINDDTPVPALILHYRYYGDTLVITALTAPRGIIETTDTHYIFRYVEFFAEQFPVKPIYSVAPSEDIPIDTSFISTRIAIGYILGNVDGYAIPASLHFDDDVEVTYQHQQQVTVILKKSILQTILQQIQP